MKSMLSIQSGCAAHPKINKLLYTVDKPFTYTHVLPLPFCLRYLCTDKNKGDGTNKRSLSLPLCQLCYLALTLNYLSELKKRKEVHRDPILSISIDPQFTLLSFQEQCTKYLKVIQIQKYEISFCFTTYSPKASLEMR